MNVTKEIQRINKLELDNNLGGDASWHAKYKDSAYVFAGNLAREFSEGDVLVIFSQYGEISDVNLVRDDEGKSKGFCFLKYSDQRSTILAVDNLNNTQVCGRTIRVDHVDQYKQKDEEKEEEKKEQRKAERKEEKKKKKKGADDTGAWPHDLADEPDEGKKQAGPNDVDEAWEREFQQMNQALADTLGGGAAEKAVKDKKQKKQEKKEKRKQEEKESKKAEKEERKAQEREEKNAAKAAALEKEAKEKALAERHHRARRSRSGSRGRDRGRDRSRGRDSSRGRDRSRDRDRGARRRSRSRDSGRNRPPRDRSRSRNAKRDRGEGKDTDENANDEPSVDVFGSQMSILDAAIAGL